MEVYKDVIKCFFGYLVVDMLFWGDDKFRFRIDIFLGEDFIVYLCL